mmetsp:Transcript_27983/g.73800  ORF Transcript_27983/g.73800 Transcript_27983/m.73800 type:complete len:244 (-) Transcript_27983:2010-2741(-)
METRVRHQILRMVRGRAATLKSIHGETLGWTFPWVAVQVAARQLSPKVFCLSSGRTGRRPLRTLLHVLAIVLLQCRSKNRSERVAHRRPAMCELLVSPHLALELPLEPRMADQTPARVFYRVAVDQTPGRVCCPLVAGRTPGKALVQLVVAAAPSPRMADQTPARVFCQVAVDQTLGRVCCPVVAGRTPEKASVQLEVAAEPSPLSTSCQSSDRIPMRPPLGLQYHAAAIDQQLNRSRNRFGV